MKTSQQISSMPRFMRFVSWQWAQLIKKPATFPRLHIRSSSYLTARPPLVRQYAKQPKVGQLLKEGVYIDKGWEKRSCHRFEVLMKERGKQRMCSTHLASSFWDVLADLLCLLRALLHNEILCLPLQQYWQLFSACSIAMTFPGWHQNHFKCDHFDEDRSTTHPHS